MQKPRGVVAMLTIFIFMAVVLSIATSVALLGQDSIALAGVFQNGEQAFAVADACAEEGFNRLKQNAAFTSSSFVVDGGQCNVVVANLGGNTRLVTGTGTYGNALRIVEVNVTIKYNNAGTAKKVTINSWHEGT